MKRKIDAPFAPRGLGLRLFLAFLLWIMTSATRADCPPARLLESGLALTPSLHDHLTTRSDIDLQAGQRLYAFSRVQGNPTGTIYHRWYDNGRPLDEVRLAATPGTWQGWSAVRVSDGHAGNWQVDILDGNRCLLGRASFPAGATESPLAQAQALLDKQDVTGAKLLIKKALERPEVNAAERRRWQQFLDRELVLAEVENDITQGHLIAAEGRLSALADKLDSSLLPRYQQLLQRLDAARAANDETTLFHFMAAIRSLALTGSCPGDLEQAKAMLKPWRGNLPVEIVQWNGKDGKGSLTITLPSGKSKTLSWGCEKLLQLP